MSIFSQGERGIQMTPASMGLGMSGVGGGDFPTAIIEGPPGMPGEKGILHCGLYLQFISYITF